MPVDEVLMISYIPEEGFRNLNGIYETWNITNITKAYEPFPLDYSYLG